MVRFFLSAYCLLHIACILLRLGNANESQLLIQQNDSTGGTETTPRPRYRAATSAPSHFEYAMKEKAVRVDVKARLAPRCRAEWRFRRARARTIRG